MKQAFMKSKELMMVLLGIGLLGTAMLVSSCGSKSSPTSSSSSTPTFTATPVATTAASVPSGYLYTLNNKIYLSSGTVGTQWMGRGVNMDDVFFSGYNYEFGSFSPATSCETTMEQVVSNLVSGINTLNFIRISLSMNSGYDGPTGNNWPNTTALT